MSDAKTGATRLAALAAALMMTLAACGGGDVTTAPEGGTGGAPSEEPAASGLSGASFTVGSKEFTEQLILGQIAIMALEDAGAQVDDQTGITGTTNVRKALDSGEIDMYWEYTGTGWTTHLGHEVSEAPADSQELFDAVAEEDLQKNDVKWFALAPGNNAYAIATSQDTMDQLGVQTLSDYAKVAGENPADASLCAASEFLDRDDGLPGLEKTYDFDLPESAVTEVELGIIFTQVPKGNPCKFGEVFATDGRIPANNMVVIEDDQNFFVKYNLAMTTSNKVYEENPAVEDVFAPIAEKLTTEKLQELNSQVDVDGLLVEQVAQEFLESEGLIG
jgi:osmoprotectant transport system substrate-binding protein